jgi:hypothetical protein
MGEPELRDQLEAIRRGLRRSGREMVLSCAQSFLHGAAVLLGCGLSLPLVGRPWWQMTALWGGLVALALAADGVLYLRLARRDPGKYLTGLERQLLVFLALLVACGLAVSAALLVRGQPELAPGLWMLLAGVGYAAVGLFSFSGLWVLGVLACLGGGIALFLEPAPAFGILAAVLGAGSFAWGLVQRRRETQGGLSAPPPGTGMR